MKILYKTIWLCLAAVCFYTLTAAPAAAKVCFVGEEDCAGGGSFEDYKDLGEDGTLCTQEGYTSKTSCQADMTKYIAGYCPYNSNYVMCCGREYSYDACVYPLVADGKCGNKFKCKCDESKYPYKQQSATVCKNTVTGQSYDNSIASGASCVYTGFANGQTAINAYFTECLCDRGLYPKTEEECSTDGASVSEKACTDSNGNKYYSACICSDDFKKIASECAYGININEPMCQQADVIKVKKCCECNINTYPYGDIDDVEGSNSPVASYASCEKEKGCTRGSRYRATSCKTGYKVVSGECVPLTCGEYLRDVQGKTVATTIDELKTALSDSSNSNKDIVYSPEQATTSWESITVSTMYGKSLASGQGYAAQYPLWCNSAPRPKVKFESKLTSTSNMQKFENIDLYFYGSSSDRFSILSGVKFNNVYAEFLWGAKIYGASINNSNFKLIDNTYIYSDAQFNNTKITVTSFYDFIISGSNTVFSDSSFEGGEGEIIVQNNFKPVNTDFNVKTITMDIGLSYEVFISGSASHKINIRADEMSLRGIAGINYANVYIKDSCIGCSNCKGGRPNNLYREGGISLYNTKWYLYENSVPHNICVGSRNIVGTPTSNGKDFASTNSYIVTSRSSKRGLYSQAGQHKYCSSGNACGSNNFYYIGSNGRKIQGIHICDTLWCVHRGKGNNSSSRNTGGFIIFNGNEDIWGHDGGDARWGHFS